MSLLRTAPIHAPAIPRPVHRDDPSASDHSLIRRLRGGDASALDPLFRRHAPALVALAARITGSVEDGKDVVQDVFVRLTTTAGGFRDDGDAAAWLRGVTAKTALNARRKTTRRRETTAVALESLRDRADSATALDLANAVDVLPAALREVFLLKIIAGYSHQEIAEMLGVRTGTSEVRLFRAIRQLRTLLSERP